MAMNLIPFQSGTRHLIPFTPYKKSPPEKQGGFFYMAERQGFEPWDGRPSLVFKTSAFDHSATSP